MSAIPQRLRTWADRLLEDDHIEYATLADEMRQAAAELEAPPAADAVPVVAWLHSVVHSDSSDADEALSFSHDNFPMQGLFRSIAHEPLIRQRDHLAAVAELQARINELEADLQFRREFQHGAEALAGKYLTQRDDARDRIAYLAGENFALAAGQCIVPGGLCGDESGNQYCSLQARINALEARQWTQGSTLPPRHKNGCESITVLAWAETGDGCFQLTPAKVLHMSKGEWREVRFDHDGMGRKIVVRCWTQMPKFPRSRVGSQPDTSKEQP